MRPRLDKRGIKLEGRAQNGGHYCYWLFHRRHPLTTLRDIPRVIRAARAIEDRNEIIL